MHIEGSRSHHMVPHSCTTSVIACTVVVGRSCHCGYSSRSSTDGTWLVSFQIWIWTQPRPSADALGTLVLCNKGRFCRCCWVKFSFSRCPWTSSFARKLTIPLLITLVFFRCFNSNVWLGSFQRSKCLAAERWRLVTLCFFSTNGSFFSWRSISEDCWCDLFWTSGSIFFLGEIYIFEDFWCVLFFQFFVWEIFLMMFDVFFSGPVAACFS